MNSEFCGWEKLSLVDFDSYLACILFTNGCNFKCSYCHNSELLNASNFIDWDEIKTYLVSYRKMLDAVVISGGEPLLKPQIYERIKEIKSLGYLIKVDTNGTNPILLKRLIDEKLVDYVAMDIKSSLDGYNDVACCQVDLSKIQESIKILMNSNIRYEFRTTLIKEFHNEEKVKKIGSLIKGAKVLYLQKFVMRETCPDQTLHEVEESEALKYKQILEKDIEKVALRGY